MYMKIIARRRETLSHLNRIIGQINTLKKYVEADRCCADIAQLSTSIAKSLDSLRARTLEGFILNEFSEDMNIPKKKREKLQIIMKLYKK